MNEPGSFLNTLHEIPFAYYRDLVLVIAGILAAVAVLKLVLRVNRVVLVAVLVVGFSLLMANWLYYRDEPAVLAPFFDVVAQYLPSGNTNISI